jgi:O-acetylserine/cysteine efflux transporter
LNFKDVCLALIVALSWGLNFTFTKYAMNYYPPLFLLVMRYFLVAALICPFLKPPSISLKDQLILAMAGVVIYLGALYIAFDIGATVAVSVIMTQLNVPLTALMAVYFLKDTIGWKRIVGTTISFAGVVITIGIPQEAGSVAIVLLLLLSAAGLAFYNIYVKRIGNVNILSLTGYSGLYGGIILLVLSLIFEDINPEKIMLAPVSAIFAVIYMAVFSTIVGFGLWFYLLSKHPVSDVALFSLLVPIIGIVSSAFLLDEIITTQIVIGSAITIGGVALVTLKVPSFLVRDVEYD